MTKTERLEAYRMRLDGVPVIRIAERFGVSRQYIYDIIPNVGKPVKGCIYPNLNEWMMDNEMGVFDLARAINVSPSGLADFLRGQHDTRKKTIDKILNVTGMTYEHAFVTEVANGAEV